LHASSDVRAGGDEVGLGAGGFLYHTAANMNYIPLEKENRKAYKVEMVRKKKQIDK
jgi:hypothetical protein